MYKDKLFVNNNSGDQMKKILMLLVLIFLVGCNNSNTPVGEVEKFLSKYQNLDNEIIVGLNNELEDDTSLTEDQRTLYLDLWKKHYKNLKYSIKDSKIEDDRAIVTVSIEVTDYTKSVNESDIYRENHMEEFQDEAGNYDIVKFNDFKISQLMNVTDTIKFEIDFQVIKTDGKWVLSELTNDDYLKLSGMYNY